MLFLSTLIPAYFVDRLSESKPSQPDPNPQIRVLSTDVPTGGRDDEVWFNHTSEGDYRAWSIDVGSRSKDTFPKSKEYTWKLPDDKTFKITVDMQEPINSWTILRVRPDGTWDYHLGRLDPNDPTSITCVVKTQRSGNSGDTEGSVPGAAVEEGALTTCVDSI